MKRFCLILIASWAMPYLSYAKQPEQITDTRWKFLIGERANHSYNVKLGDSLSGISQEQLGDKSYWPKLWEVNKENIRNPHLLEPEQEILFGRMEVLNSRAPANQDPAVPKKKKILEEQPDQFLSSQFANQHRLRYLILEGEEVLGVVTGSYDEKNYLGPESKIYIGPLAKNKLEVGHRYAVVREAKSKGVSEQLIQVIGEVEIEEFGDELVRAAIVSAHDLVERGDRVMDIPALSMQDPPLNPPTDITARVLLGEDMERSWSREGQLVVLDRGKSAGIKLGHLFRVYEDTDPIFKKQKLIEPRSKGEVKIVRVSENSSVGYIQKSSMGIEVGDILLANTVLSSSVKPLKTYRSTVVLD